MSAKVQRGMARFAMLIEILIVTAVAIATAVAVTRAGGRVSGLQWLIVPCIWIAAALLPTMLRRRPWAQIGLKTGKTRESLKLFGWTALVVLPLVFCGVFLLRRWGLVPPLQPGPAEGRWELWIVYQLFYVAVAEEVFFRGYVQSNIMSCLTQVAPQRPRMWSTASILISSAVFALAHVAVVGTAMAGLVFFPALIFGWLRARTDSLLAPTLFHATANMGYAIACALAQ